MNPVFQPQTPTFTNGFNQFPTPFPNQFPFPQAFSQGQGCPVTGYANYTQGTQIDPIFSNVAPTVRQNWTNGWTNTPWANTPWTNTPWTNTFNATPWNTVNPTWNGFYPTNSGTFPMNTWNTTPFQQGYQQGFQNTWPTFNGMTNPFNSFNPFNAFPTSSFPQWNGFAPMNAAPFNSFPTSTFGFNGFPFTTPFAGFMPTAFTPTAFTQGFWPTNFAFQGFFPTNFAPTNFAPTNFAPTGYTPTNYIPTNYAPMTTTQNFTPAQNFNQPQQYTQPQNGYPTNTQQPYPQQAYQPGYGYPSYAGVSPVSVPTSMDPSEKSNKRTVMSREG